MNELQTKTQILEGESVARKIFRMALEVAEQNIGEQNLVIAGINGNGEVVAKCLASELKKMSSFATEVVTIVINKKEPGEVAVSPDIVLDNKIVLLVDDVANTGQTMFYALKPFLAARLKRLQTAVLVERSHKQFPIQTDYTGLSIATTLQEHIAVETEGDEITGAWLY
ncbi:MAG TPA: phosphoribosyltransferase family protein [Flavisolibacter sp.]|jgi:pyrimidine operon attenuation protein/uracil phosphoribosyltransferase|nr:phosphoribosyltransferase family protein [Flavisolibacter sp.]